MRYGLIGEKLGHSFSKNIHESFKEYEYELIELSLDEFDDFMMKKDFDAINVTIPYKEKVLQYLDYVDPTAMLIGACNVVINNNGKLCGYNVDVNGLVDLIHHSEIEVKDKKVLILGTGGTSKTAYYVLNMLGAKEIIKVSRNSKLGAVTYEEAYLNHHDADVIVNTTPVGMYPHINEVPIDLEKFSSLSGVIDVVYNPLHSKLVLTAKNMNIKAVSGLYMLVSQALNSYGLFLAKDVFNKEIEETFVKFYERLSNISFIGMPGSGKSTYGEILSQAVHKKWIDTDYEIEEIIKMPISDYIEKYGEQEFRKIEKDVVKNTGLNNGQIISTGGGVVLDEENIFYLKANGMVVFINRDLELLEISEDRPLSNTYEKLEKLYNERIDLYRKYADFVIDNNGDEIKIEGDEDEEENTYN